MRFLPSRLSGFATLVALLGAAPLGAAEAPPATAAAFTKSIRPLLEKYCAECHGKGTLEDEGEFHLTNYRTPDDLRRDPKKWQEALEHIRTRQMPPENAAYPLGNTERTLLADWLDRVLFAADPANPDPGRVVIHRLNRTEYDRAIRDLLDVDFRPADDFPADDSGHGFDNISDVLSLSPMLLEKYVAAATKALDLAIPTGRPATSRWHFGASKLETGFNETGDRGDGWMRLYSLFEGDVAAEFEVPVTGHYEVSFQAFGENQNGNIYGASGPIPNSPPEIPVLWIFVNDTAIQAFPIEATEAAPETYRATVTLPAGKQRIRVVLRRHRGGENERVVDTMARYVGRQNNGIGWVKWIEVSGPSPGSVTRQPAAALIASGATEVVAGAGRLLTDASSVALPFTVTREGDYLLRAYADATQAGPEPARMEFRVDGQAVHAVEVHAPSAYLPFTDPKTKRPWNAPADHLVAVPQRYEFTIRLTPGQKFFAAAFLNPYSDPAEPNPNFRARSLTLRTLEVVALGDPVPVTPISAGMRAYLAREITPRNRSATARDILAKFTRRAWRRIPAPEDLDRLMVLFADADRDAGSFEAALKLPLTAVLVSPNFLFRAEFPQAETRRAAKASLGVPVDEFSLASRLSFFLWSSVPDDELLDLAAKGRLRQNLAPQVRRMLASPKSLALVDNFAGQWLQFRALSAIEPDRKLFPRFSPVLRADMEQETALFAGSILRGNRSVLEFLTADYTFVNARLAAYYGLPAPTGDGFQRVSLAGTPRQGVLSQGSFLLGTSNPTRTSPVKRGRFVLDQILGTPVPPAPPGIVSNVDAPEQAGLTQRQRIEKHRSDPSCASCHALMDPLGLGFENFDAVGAWRDTEDYEGKTVAVDAAGRLVSGESFASPKQLIGVLASGHRADYYRNVAQKMLTYALGRGVESHGSDRLALEQIATRLSADDRAENLILAVTESFLFQMMRRPGNAAVVATE
jgi:mono/diheme cytochrome c family protein